MLRGWQCVVLVACIGCAGKLRDPKRFDFLLHPDGGVAGKSGGAAGANGSAGGGSDPNDCIAKVFTDKCNSSSCHGSGAPQLDLVSSGFADRLVGKDSSPNLSCKGRKLVATDGTSSLLVQKLDDPAPCGAKMPLVGSLTQAERKCITDWVDAQAN